jgi:thioredoxin reductase (NADPH)
VQAQKFGAEIVIPSPVVRLDCATHPFTLEMADGRRATARTIVVASGARYRRPPIPNLEAFEGRGVWYWASPIEARLCGGQHVALVGGGNSAGQAAVFLSGFAAKVSVLVRDHGLEASMSRYLIDRIEATANIEVLPRTEITTLIGGPGSQLARVRWRRAITGDETELPICHLFLFGVEPATAWLRDCGIELDPRASCALGRRDHRPRPLPLESSIPGVFAVGDVRLSAKRSGWGDRRGRRRGGAAPHRARGRSRRCPHFARALDERRPRACRKTGTLVTGGTKGAGATLSHPRAVAALIETAAKGVDVTAR